MGMTIQRLFGSVFTKILAVILLTGLGINLAVGPSSGICAARRAANTARPSSLSRFDHCRNRNTSGLEKAAALAAREAFICATAHRRGILPRGRICRRLFRFECKGGSGSLSQGCAPYFRAAASLPNWKKPAASSSSKSGPLWRILKSPSRWPVASAGQPHTRRGIFQLAENP